MCIWVQVRIKIGARATALRYRIYGLHRVLRTILVLSVTLGRPTAPSAHASPPPPAPPARPYHWGGGGGLGTLCAERSAPP